MLWNGGEGSAGGGVAAGGHTRGGGVASRYLMQSEVFVGLSQGIGPVPAPWQRDISGIFDRKRVDEADCHQPQASCASCISGTVIVQLSRSRPAGMFPLPRPAVRAWRGAVRYDPSVRWRPQSMEWGRGRRISVVARISAASGRRGTGGLWPGRPAADAAQRLRPRRCDHPPHLREVHATRCLQGLHCLTRDRSGRRLLINYMYSKMPTTTAVGWPGLCISVQVSYPELPQSFPHGWYT